MREGWRDMWTWAEMEAWFLGVAGDAVRDGWQAVGGAVGGGLFSQITISTSMLTNNAVLIHAFHMHDWP